MILSNTNFQIYLFDPLTRLGTGITISDQSGPGSNGKERVLCLKQSPGIGASLRDAV